MWFITSKSPIGNLWIPGISDIEVTSQHLTDRNFKRLQPEIQILLLRLV